MSFVQLRLPPHETLPALADHLADEITDILARHHHCCGVHPNEAEIARSLLRLRLHDCIAMFQPCGQRERCHKNLKRLSWKWVEDMDHWVPPASFGNERIFLVDLDKAFSDWTAELARDLCEAFRRNSPKPCWRPPEEEVDALIRRVVGPYLFENPACELCPFCTEKTRMDPWARPSGYAAQMEVPHA